MTESRKEINNLELTFDVVFASEGEFDTDNPVVPTHDFGNPAKSIHVNGGVQERKY
jgi:hypothetical protein